MMRFPLGGISHPKVPTLDTTPVDSFLSVPVFVHLGHGYRREGCRSREGRSGNRLKDRGADHGGQGKSTGHVTDILSNRVIELPCHTRIKDNLSHQDKKRNHREGIGSEGDEVIFSEKTNRGVRKT